MHTPLVLVAATPVASLLLHIDEPRAHAFHGSCLDDEKIDRWYLDTGATHHMTKRQEYFSDLDSTVRGYVKFGVASALEIVCVGSVIFVAKTREHQLSPASTTSPPYPTPPLAWDR